MRKLLFRRFAALCAAVLALHISGCFGSFTLTRKVYDLNREISENKFVQWVVFLGMVIIPVYGVAALVDGLVFNSLEFWTGNNPLASAEGEEDGTRVVRLSPTDTLRLSRDAQSGVMRAELEREGQEPLVRYFEPLEDGMAVRDEAGALLMRAHERVDGALEITDGSGTAVTVHSREAMAQARSAFLQGGAAGLARHVVPQASPMSQGLALACVAQ